MTDSTQDTILGSGQADASFASSGAESNTQQPAQPVKEPTEYALYMRHQHMLQGHLDGLLLRQGSVGIGANAELDAAVSNARQQLAEHNAKTPAITKADIDGVIEIVYADENGIEIVSIENEDRGGGTNGHTYGVFNGGRFTGCIEFQNGPIPKFGTNGFTNEALIAVVLHRTKYVNGLFPSSFNETAIAGLQQALDAFNARTADRKARQVEGTLQV